MDNKRIGLFPMCADILHAGHILALEEAKKNCDHLIVALNTHPDGKNPVQSVAERFLQLRAVKFVDEVIPYQGRADMEILASALDYDVRYLGSDYMDKEWDGKEQEIKRGIEPYFVKRLHGLSSSELKLRIDGQELKNCVNCRYNGTMPYDPPCVTCRGCSMWEKKQKVVQNVRYKGAIL